MKQVGVTLTVDEFKLLVASRSLANTEIGSLISEALRGAFNNNRITLFFLPQDIPQLAAAAGEQKITIQINRRD